MKFSFWLNRKLGYILISDLIENFKRLVVLDLRKREKYFEYHISLGRMFVGVNIPFKNSEFLKKINYFNNKFSHRDIVICSESLSYAKKARTLLIKKFPLRKIFILKGGFSSYKKYMVDLKY